MPRLGSRTDPPETLRSLESSHPELKKQTFNTCFSRLPASDFIPAVSADTASWHERYFHLEWIYELCG